MRNIWILMWRDVKSYFASFIAYALIMIFLAILGYFFFSFTFIYARLSMYMGSDPSLAHGITPMDAVLRPIFMNMSIIMLLILPIVSMRSFSEEKKQGTLELLLTYPIKNHEIVLGKYFGLITFFKLMLLPTFLYPLFLIACNASLPILPLISAYVGIFLLGASFLALGLFASSLSENQTISAALSFGFLLLFWVIGWSSDVARVSWLSQVLKEISMIEHYRNMVMGLVNTNDLVYYLFFTVFFLFLTMKVLEKRNWR